MCAIFRSSVVLMQVSVHIHGPRRVMDHPVCAGGAQQSHAVVHWCVLRVEERGGVECMCLGGGSLRTPIPCHTGLPKLTSTRGSLSLHHQPFHSPHNPGSGSTYSIWKLTDLDQTTLSIFLFSGAHDELWKQAPGTLIAIFTPKVKNDRELCLTAISGDQVWVLGTAAEFGYCRAQKKVWRREECMYIPNARHECPLGPCDAETSTSVGPSPSHAENVATVPHRLPFIPSQDGQPCRVPVNMARCPFCPYHVQVGILLEHCAQMVAQGESWGFLTVYLGRRSALFSSPPLTDTPPPPSRQYPPAQLEYNRVKPLGRNEFQGSTLSTAFRAGQQKGGLGLYGPGSVVAQQVLQLGAFF